MPANASTQLKTTCFAILTALALTACGGGDEKPAPSTKSSPAPTAEVAKPAESASTAPSDKPSEPVAEVATTSDKPAVAPAVATTDAKILATGKARFEQTCRLCHEQGLLNAPKPNDKTAWQPRLAKGMDALQQNAIKGFEKMPAQAVDGVSEDEVKSAVEYMVSLVQK